MSSKRLRPAATKKDDGDRLPYFVPDKGIDVEPLAIYTRNLMDPGVEIKLGINPHNDSQQGYWINSRKALTVEDIKAMIQDTLSYKDEREEGSANNYVESNTWARRRRLGRAEQNVEGNRTLPPVTRAASNVFQTQRSPDPLPAVQDPFSPRPPLSATPSDRSGYGGNYQQPDLRQQQQGGFNNQQYGVRGVMFAVESRQPYDERQSSLPVEYSQDRSYEPAPPYFEQNKPNPPSTTGAPGFSAYKTAGPGRNRHDT